MLSKQYSNSLFQEQTIQTDDDLRKMIYDNTNQTINSMLIEEKSVDIEDLCELKSTLDEEIDRLRDSPQLELDSLRESSMFEQDSI